MLKHGITFSLHKRNTDESSDLETYFPVRMRVSFNGQRPDFYTGVSIREIDWNPETQRSWQKKGFENSELNKLETVISDIFDDFYYQHKRFPTVKELRNEFKFSTNKSVKITNSDISILQLFDDYTNHVGTLHQWKEGRFKKYNQLRNHWEIYNKDLLLNDLKEKDLIGFIQYFENGPLDFKTRKKKQPHKNTSIAKEFADFTAMLKWSAKRDIYKGNLHETFTPVFKGSEGGLIDLVYLSWDELMKMYNHDFENAYKNKIRDMFCFLCFTGMRYSDLKKLKKSHVKDDYIIVVTEKTIDPLRIDLNDFSRELIEKYWEFSFPNNILFPVVSSQNFNDDIKVISEILEFDEIINEVYFVGSKRFEITHIKHQIISSHAGRRTFVTNGITMGIPADVIMKWTGHKDLRAMKPYIKIVDELRKSEMSKFNKR
ncbi:site-specific integrase [Epilithonimonas xixisoli]|uniref:Integrase-like protein n=1 Tax=Epilithonimonas xixisoli TaxID=1476462 RepID=A0A4R8I4Z4_9FLAO|nr:site-specific integrase [Epilithonimonas xixisoli]TDX83932.1 integrase-like protein [Epilithonimonas xixisoli]